MISAGHLLKEAVRAQMSGSPKEAAFLYQQLLNQHPDNAAALCNLGLIRQQDKQYEEAEKLLRRAIAADARFTDAYVNLTNVLHEQRRYDEAIGLCEAALKFASGNQYLLNNLATNLHGAGEHAKAIAVLERVIAAHPGYSQGSYNIAKMYEAMGNTDQAVRYYLQAARLKPRDATSLVAAGECLLKAGKAGDALAIFDKVLVLDAYDVRALALKSLALAELGQEDQERLLSDPGRLVRLHRLEELGLSPPEIAEFNRALSEFASNHPTMREDPPDNATYNGWHSKNLAYDSHPAVEKLKKFIAYALDQRRRGLVDESRDHPFARSLPRNFGLNLWAVRMVAGGKMIPHIHTDGWLSGVYYVDVPGVVYDPEAGEAGWIKFGSPRNDIHLTKQTMTRTVRPEPGLLVTFPSYFWHDTIPLPEYNTEQRLSMAFDLEPKAVP
ncbi:MAG: tetratricopeptide repeat protein [Betaproteobacteria bacterium]|nr:tetratricopeptide repeat protein [Betaproteobacteria bacterium]